MQQDRNLYNEETHRMAERTYDHDDDQTGSDLPSGDGDVGDEQVDAIGRDDSDKPTGQDHSTDRHELESPTEGVGAVQDSSQPASSRADIDDEQNRLI